MAKRIGPAIRLRYRDGCVLMDDPIRQAENQPPANVNIRGRRFDHEGSGFRLPGTTSISSRIGRMPRPAVWALTLPENVPIGTRTNNALKRDMDTPITATPSSE